jgi:phosphatidylserine/phosphatidylglycerophosphate/cardiolipin synthase-like enzyme
VRKSLEIAPLWLRAGAFTLAALALALAQLACSEQDLDGGRTVTDTVSGDWIRVYFTSPRYPDDGSRQGGIDEPLVAAIDQAQTSVDVAAYDLDLQSVADALIAAHARGVQVRFVTESDNADEEAVLALQDAGIPVIEDGRDEGLMHNKFVVIDRQWVWTGSWNLTWSETHRNNNNPVLIASAPLEANYPAEFEEMFARRFGPASSAGTPHPHITIAFQSPGGQTREVALENYFAPEDGVAAHLVAEIERAQSRIRFMAFSFTSDAIADRMIARARAGVAVQGVIEERNAESEYGQYRRLRDAGLDVRLDGNPYLMHHKVIIVDDATVLLGSYNFTSSAERTNDENLLIIHDPEVAARFVAEFGRLYEQAR